MSISSSYSDVFVAPEKSNICSDVIEVIAAALIQIKGWKSQFSLRTFKLYICLLHLTGQLTQTDKTEIHSVYLTWL